MWLGWRLAFAAYGVAAIFFAVIWHALCADSPETCSYCSQDERELLATSIPTSPKRTSVPDEPGSPLSPRSGLGLAVGHACLWAIYQSHFVFNYGIYFVNSWSATYYLEVFHLRPSAAALYLSLPHATNLVVILFLAPWLRQALHRRNMSVLAGRRITSGLGFLISAVALALVPFASGPRVTTALFCVAMGAYALHPSGFKANYMDVTAHNGGVVSGLGNTISSTASSFGPLAVASLRQHTGSWAPAFHSVFVVNCLAALVFCSFSKATPVELEECEKDS